VCVSWVLVYDECGPLAAVLTIIQELYGDEWALAAEEALREVSGTDGSMLFENRTYADVFLSDVIVDIVDAELGASTMSRLLETYSRRVEVAHTAPRLCQRSRSGRQRGLVVACGRSGRLRSGRGPSRYWIVNLPTPLQSWSGFVACSRVDVGMLISRVLWAVRRRSATSLFPAGPAAVADRSSWRISTIRETEQDGMAWHGFLGGRRIWHLEFVVNM